MTNEKIGDHRWAIESALSANLDVIPSEVNQVGNLLEAAGHLRGIEEKETDPSALGSMIMKYALALQLDWPAEKIGSLATHFFDMPLAMGHCRKGNRIIWSKMDDMEMPEVNRGETFGEIIGEMVQGVFHGNWRLEKACNIQVSMTSDSVIDVVLSDGHRDMTLKFTYGDSVGVSRGPLVRNAWLFDDRLIYVFDELMDDIDGLHARANRPKMMALVEWMRTKDKPSAKDDGLLN